MRRIAHSWWTRGLAALLLALLIVPALLRAEDRREPQLSPTADQPRTAGLILGLLGKTHLRRLPLDDVLSGRLLDRYLQFLDPARVHFLATDVEEFQSYRKELDDDLKEGDLLPAFRIFNRFQERRIERLEYLNQAVAAGLDKLDLTVEESLTSDRKDAPWPADMAAARDIWRRLLKADVISLRLAGSSMEDVQKTLGKRYEDQLRRAGQIESRDVFALFMNTLALLHDPHTEFFPPRRAENFSIDMKLSLTGIGALLGVDGEYTKIQRLIPGGPAEKGGQLHPGDRIAGVAQGDDGEVVNIVGWRLDEVVDRIRGPKDSVVRLEILGAAQPPGGQTHMVRVVRDKVRLEDQAARSRIIELDRDGKKVRIGMIELPSFYMDMEAMRRRDPNFRSSARDVAKILTEFGAQEVDAVVLDLRNNPGGSLHEAVGLAGLFVGQVPIVAVKDSAGRIQNFVSPVPEIYRGPLVVLVNRASASASEIVAAAIQDYGRGLIVGGTTFGKGTVQHLAPLDHGQLKLTRQKYYRVSGGSTQARGVVPDLAFPPQFDYEIVGESSLDESLPWDTIEPLRETDRSKLEAMLPKLQRRHQARIGQDPEFNYLDDRKAIFEEMRKAKSFSLNLEERQKSLDELNARLLEVENVRRKAEGKEPLESLPTAGGAEAPGDEPGAEPDTAAPKEEENPDPWAHEAAEILADVLTGA